jgi:GNAT superfamily N-acetyltransferase
VNHSIIREAITRPFIKGCRTSNQAGFHDQAGQPRKSVSRNYEGRINNGNEMHLNTVLSGHDGRRGILRHLAVVKQYRNLGISKDLVNRALHSLKNEGICKCNIYVLNENENGIKYWEHNGWQRHEDNFFMMFKDTLSK